VILTRLVKSRPSGAPKVTAIQHRFIHPPYLESVYPLWLYPGAVVQLSVTDRIDSRRNSPGPIAFCSRIRKLGVNIYSIVVKIGHTDITIAIRSKDGKPKGLPCLCLPYDAWIDDDTADSDCEASPGRRGGQLPCKLS
jgi:hypothetical protein